jgi:quercetin dioxygenase-like cupin family protein
MTEQLRDIGYRLSALRSIAEITPEEFCKKTGVNLEELSAYEKGELDFSFSFMYNAARILGVDVVDLMSGDSPRLSNWSMVRKGEGYAIDRDDAHKYVHLAFTFRDKKAEPFLVTAEPNQEKLVQHSHEGQEFMWLINGRLRFTISDTEYMVEPGDSVYFNSAIPHAMEAMDNQPAQFIAIVMS